jgi:kynureninase
MWFLPILQLTVSVSEAAGTLRAVNAIVESALDLSEAEALRLDAADPLTGYRDRFEMPLGPDGEPAMYFCGHSLGPLPHAARTSVDEELDAWGRLGIGGHFRELAPWFTYAELLAEATARVVGALPVEVVTMNALTVNLHMLLASFYRPTNERFRVLMEAGAFPSDRYAMASHLRSRGVNPAQAIRLVEPRAGEATLRTEDIEARIAEEGSQLALVWLPGVQYLTGQRLDIERITAAGAGTGCVVGWDLAHAPGNVPLRLHDWGVDFAVWCTYKYMNAGPGSIGQAFVHERWARDVDLPRYAGWWGNDPETRFAFSADFEPRDGAAGWQVSNPPILALAPLRASLAIFDEVGMEVIRARSERLTAYLESHLDALGIGEQITPRDAAARGAQLSLRVGARAQRVERDLGQRGVVIDLREPDVIRFAPAPLYNTFHEAWRFARVLAEVLGERDQ